MHSIALVSFLAILCCCESFKLIQHCRIKLKQITFIKRTQFTCFTSESNFNSLENLIDNVGTVEITTESNSRIANLNNDMGVTTNHGIELANWEDNEEASFCTCVICKSSYIVDETKLGVGGSQVKCTVCGRQWLLSKIKLHKIGSTTHVTNMTNSTVSETKKILKVQEFLKTPLRDTFGIYIANLPYEYGENDIIDLFGEYGILNVKIIRNLDTGVSKGYAFIKVYNDIGLEFSIVNSFQTNIFLIKVC